MQLTILSVKLPNQTDEQFKHEFGTIHLASTREMASSTGLISRYVQGNSLSVIGTPILNPPLPERKVQLQSYAQLTWPSKIVLQGSLHSPGYKNSAGKHIFATSAHIFLTDRLELDTLLQLAPESELKPLVMLTMLLLPSSEDTVFRTSWDEHAARFRSRCLSYQRNAAMSLSRSKVEEVLKDTAFLPELCQLRGGYEEFVFQNVEEAQQFVDKYGSELVESYGSFCSNESYFAAFTCEVKYNESEVGMKQVVIGTLISNVLRVQTLLGL